MTAGEPELLGHWEGEPVRVWEEVWAVPGLEVWSTIGSTNDRARELASEGAPAHITVVAEEQTTGRGRKGRLWSSPPGLGLWMSTVLRPPAPEGRSLVPILVGLAVCRAAESVAGVECALKWPNDVLVGERKVAGVLCEATGGAVVAGIGVNVAQRTEDFPPELRDGAVSLETVREGVVSRAGLAGALTGELRALFDRPTLRLEGRVADEVGRRDALRDREVVVDGELVGRARGIDPGGRLVVQAAEGIRHVVAGSVRVRTGGRGSLVGEG